MLEHQVSGGPRWWRSRLPLRGNRYRIRPFGPLPVLPRKRTLPDRPGWSVQCRFCCKSRFAKVVKILTAAGAFFSYGSEGPHRRTPNSQAISAARLGLYESSVALHAKNSPKIRTDATSDFCNKICQKWKWAQKKRGVGSQLSRIRQLRGVLRDRLSATSPGGKPARHLAQPPSVVRYIEKYRTACCLAR